MKATVHIKRIIKQLTLLFMPRFGSKIVMRSANNPKTFRSQVDLVLKERFFKQKNELFESLVQESRAQIRQDIVALALNDFKNDGGVFCEIGATDGLILSNTYLLEKMGWKGLLVEPCRKFNKKILSNRTSRVDTRAVFEQSGVKLEFFESRISELSSLHRDYEDSWIKMRNFASKRYYVQSISLEDLIKENFGSQTIDFLSIDIEGGEISALKTFHQISKQVRFVVVETSNNPSRITEISALMKKSRFKRINMGYQYWDEWFCNETELKKIAKYNIQICDDD